MFQHAQKVVLALLTSILCVSCTTVIHPPPAPVDPEMVILLTHGRSSSLMLPDQSGDATRWAYGDWRYYALGKKRLVDAAAAILWPTPSALGRQVIESLPRTPDMLLSRVGIGYDDAFIFSVERQAVADLQRRLDGVFRSNIDTRLYNTGPKLAFVHHPEPYHLLNSSNRKVAQWLRELGCEISGFPLLSKWKVAPVRVGRPRSTRE